MTDDRRKERRWTEADFDGTQHIFPVKDPDPDRTPIFGAVVVLVIVLTTFGLCVISEMRDRAWLQEMDKAIRPDARSVE